MFGTAITRPGSSPIFYNDLQWWIQYMKDAGAWEE